MSDRKIILNLIKAHDDEEGGCTAHGESQLCCLDDQHPLGAGLRKALGLPYPDTYKTWGPAGVVRTRPVEPFDLVPRRSDYVDLLRQHIARDLPGIFDEPSA